MSDHSTANYTVVLGRQGDVVLGVGDMCIHDEITSHYVSECSTFMVHVDVYYTDSKPDVHECIMLTSAECVQQYNYTVNAVV